MVRDLSRAQPIYSFDRPLHPAHPVDMQTEQVLRVEEYDADDAEAGGGRPDGSSTRRSAVDAPFLPQLTPFRQHDEPATRLGRQPGAPPARPRSTGSRWRWPMSSSASGTTATWPGSTSSSHPAHRRHGHGSALLSAVLERRAPAGRTKFGGAWWESPGDRGVRAAPRFRAGPPQEIYRVVAPARAPAGLRRRRVRRGGDARRRLRAGPRARAVARRSCCRPSPRSPRRSTTHRSDDLDIEDEVFPVERIRDYESATIDSGHRLYRILARHRGTGEARRPHRRGRRRGDPDTGPPARHRGGRAATAATGWGCCSRRR